MATFFHNVIFWEKVILDCSASRDIVFIWFGHYESLFQSMPLFLGAFTRP